MKLFTPIPLTCALVLAAALVSPESGLIADVQAGASGGAEVKGKEDPSGDSQKKKRALRSKIDHLEKRIGALEQELYGAGRKTGTTTPDSGKPEVSCKADIAAKACGSVTQAATCTTAQQVVVRRYLVPLGVTTLGTTTLGTTTLGTTTLGTTTLGTTTLGTTTLGTTTLGATTLGTTVAAPNVSVYSVPTHQVSTLAPVSVMAPATVYGNVGTSCIPQVGAGSTLSTWGAVPTTVYRGAGAVYSNSYNAGLLNTGSGFTFVRVR